MNDIQLRNENKFRTPIHGRNFQGTTTFVGALYPEGNVQVYWTWRWFDFQVEAQRWKGGSRWCAFQFSRQDLLLGMWDTREILIGLPYDFSHLIPTHFAEFYKRHLDTFNLSAEHREALGISEEDYIQAKKATWGENWRDLSVRRYAGTGDKRKTLKKT